MQGSVFLAKRGIAKLFSDMFIVFHTNKQKDSDEYNSEKP
jgi:hypothetical protein